MQIKQTTKRLVSQAFVRHAATLVSGNVAGQIIALAAYLLLCRMYSPEDFGLFHLFLSVGGFLAFFTTCSFQYAIVLPRNDRMGAACAQICLAGNLGAALLCLAAVCTIGPLLTEATHTAVLNPLLPLLPLYMLACGLWATLNYWFIRHKQFQGIARYQIGVSLGTSAAKLGWGSRSIPGGLVFGTLAGQYAALLAVAWRRRALLAPLLHWQALRIRVCLRKYSKFLYFTFPKDLVNYLGGNLPSLLLAPWFPLAELGFFGMAVTLAMRPVNLLVNAVYQSLYQQCIELYHQRGSMRFLGRLLLRGFLIATPCFAALYFLMPHLVRFLLGEGWGQTAVYLQLILPWILFTLLFNPFDYLPDIFGRQGTLLGFEVLQTVLRTAALLTGIRHESFALATALYSATSCLVILLRAGWYFHLVHTYEKSITHDPHPAE
ncbi:MAG: oligosaccharide flippase family protein [Paludibacteraceae bacterium]|nr:oligosaccharide flippase family protein [Paludibacteraceae bacterium]